MDMVSKNALHVRNKRYCKNVDIKLFHSLWQKMQHLCIIECFYQIANSGMYMYPGLTYKFPEIILLYLLDIKKYFDLRQASEQMLYKQVLVDHYTQILIVFDNFTL